MWNFQAIDTGLSIAKGIAGFIGASQEAESKRLWQQYNNAMTHIADGQNQNSVTTNTNLAIERSTVHGFEISKSVYKTEAEVEAAAAATGTEGRSVNQTMFQVERNGAVAQHNRKADLEAQLLGFDNQRRQSAFSAAQQIDKSVIPSPNPVTALLGIGASAFHTYNSYNQYQT